MKKLIETEVKNERSLGKLGKIIVYLTEDLVEYLKGEKTKNGEDLYLLFQRGMALRGFKHLIEKIREKNASIKIIFTRKGSKYTEDEIYISYDEYKKFGSEKFFALYRSTGLEVAGSFLGNTFPSDFTYKKEALSLGEIKRAGKNLDSIVDQLPNRPKTNRVLIDKTSKILEELTSKKKLLKEEVEALATIHKQSNISFFQSRVDELADRLKKVYPETKGKNSWQSWIYKNNWLFGVNYQKPIEKQKLSISGAMPDYLFPTLDGFFDVLEIKLPSKEIIVPDPSHTGSYAWSSDTNKAIGQVVTYLNDIELYQLHLKQEIERVYGLKCFLIKPRAFILIGNKDGWVDQQHQALRKLNYSLHGITVLSYTDLIRMGEEIITNYTKTQDE